VGLFICGYEIAGSEQMIQVRPRPGDKLDDTEPDSAGSVLIKLKAWRSLNVRSGFKKYEAENHLADLPPL